MPTAPGVLLREWRLRRRYSQLDLALLAEVSAKHLSYVETGRSRPSPEMIIHLCGRLEVPLRERNEILLAAGHAPRYRDSTAGRAATGEAIQAVERVVAAHEYPAVAVDRHWNLVTANPVALAVFLDGVSPELLTEPINVVRLSLHPDGLAPRVANFADYAAHILHRIRRSHERSPSTVLAGILDDYADLAASVGPVAGSVRLPLHLRTSAGEVELFSTISVFGAPGDVVLDEVAIESFFPLGDTSRRRLRTLSA